MYTLVIESINFDNNLFFIDTNMFDKKQAEDIFNKTKQSCNIDYDLFSSYDRVYNNQYIQTSRIHNFKSIDDAEKFSYVMNTNTSDYRLSIRKWNSDNNVLSKFYICDDKNNIVKTLTDCEQHICQRFHGQCDSSGCSKVEFAASLRNKKIIPIVSA